MADENKQSNNVDSNEEAQITPITNEEIEKLKKQNEEYLNGWKRAKADYLNLKKEMESQNKEIKEWLSKTMILPILKVMDSFDSAFANIPENISADNWVKGIENIKRQLEDYLKLQDIKPMAVIGEKFDPAKHEAVESIDLPADKSGSGTIAAELQKGYFINGDVLRPAKVKVYK